MKTLYQQFIITTLGLMLFSTVVGFFLTNTYYQLVTKEQNDEKNVAIAQNITRYIESTPDLDLEHYLSTLGDIGYQFYVVGESGYSQFFGGAFKTSELPSSAKETVFKGDIYHGMEDYPNQSFMTGFFTNKLINTVGVPFIYDGEQYGVFLRPNIDLLFSEVHTILACLIISMAIISLIGMLFVAKQLIRPITQLTEATKQISKENYDLLLKVKRRDEIGQLASSFNQMTKQLQETDRSRKEFISNVSHDFQSPLLNIQGYSELLKSPGITEEDRLTYTSIIETETKRLSLLTKQLLLLTFLDQPTRALKRSSFALDEQLKTLIQKYLWLIEDSGIELYYKIAPIRFNGNEGLLETVWDNLLTNALKYNKPNGSIKIIVEETNEEVLIQFHDTGMGIKEEELSHVFERFYRADASRTKEGTGLGLAIVKQVVDFHGGSIRVSSQFGKETCFFITLPKQ